MTAYSNEKLQFGIQAGHSDGSAGIIYSSGGVKIKWAVTTIYADSIKTDQNSNTFETKKIFGHVFKSGAHIEIDGKLIEKVKYQAAHIQRKGRKIYLKGNASLSFENIKIKSSEITIELLPGNPSKEK
jgi:lipopolysaccharide assembly outer membrane protein LptD (OstA)